MQVRKQSPKGHVPTPEEVAALEEAVAETGFGFDEKCLI
jgi:hypothetical protein